MRHSNLAVFLLTILLILVVLQSDKSVMALPASLDCADRSVSDTELQSRTFEHPTVDELAAEALGLQSNEPERWRGWKESVEKLYADYKARNFPWRKRSMPPLPDFKPLKLPLAFLAAEIQQQNHPEDRDNHYRFHGYIEAVTEHTDVRRIHFLVEYSDMLRAQKSQLYDEYSWARTLAAASDLEWASLKLRGVLKGNPYLSTYSLHFMLMDRFGRELPSEVRAAAYRYLRRKWTKGPHNGDGERYWDVLLKLNLEQARREIIPFYADDESDLYVVVLLNEHAGPSAEVARAVRSWLATIDKWRYSLYGPELRALLLRSDPERELQPTAERIEHLIKGRAKPNFQAEWSEETETLVKAFIELDSAPAIEVLKRYVHAHAIEDMTRLEIIKLLVRHTDEELPQIMARWLVEEPDHVQSWLRQLAEREWGEYGRELLRQAEQINAAGRPPAMP